MKISKSLLCHGDFITNKFFPRSVKSKSCAVAIQISGGGAEGCLQEGSQQECLGSGSATETGQKRGGRGACSQICRQPSGKAGAAGQGAAPAVVAADQAGQGHDGGQGHVERLLRRHLRQHLLADGPPTGWHPEPHGPPAGTSLLSPAPILPGLVFRV